MTGKPVFFDPTGRRGLVLSWMGRTLGTISALVFGLFMATLAVVDQPGMERPDPSTPHPSIRCAWQPTCLPAHALNVAKAAIQSCSRPRPTSPRIYEGGASA
jgi:hypothetical protein